MQKDCLPWYIQLRTHMNITLLMPMYFKVYYRELYYFIITYKRKGSEKEYIYMYIPICVLSHFSCVQLFATLWTVARQASLSMGFSRQEYWNRLLCIPPGECPHPRIEPRSPAWCMILRIFRLHELCVSLNPSVF